MKVSESIAEYDAGFFTFTWLCSWNPYPNPLMARLKPVDWSLSNPIPNWL